MNDYWMNKAHVSRQKAQALLSKWDSANKNCTDNTAGALAAWREMCKDFGFNEPPFEDEGTIFLFEESDRPISLTMKLDTWQGWSVSAHDLCG